VLYRAYFTVHDCGRRCVLPGCACDKQTRDVFQSSRLTGETIGCNTADTVVRDKKTKYWVRQKVSPKVFCHFIRNSWEFWAKFLHVYYRFIVTWKCQRAFHHL